MQEGKIEKIFEGLNPGQREALEHGRGPLLVIAGAGTGKTTVITKRIAHLIATKKAEPEEILALTFTDKASREMEERVDVLVPYGYTDVWISTFHAFGDRVLRENALELGIVSNFQVLTRPEQIIFFREHLFEFPLSYYRPLGDPTRYIEAIVTLFSRAKDEDVSPEDYLDYARKLEREAQANPGDAAASEAARREMELALSYGKYQQLLMQYGKVDFGNQVYLALKLLREHPAILERYQKQFRYILVDEFQDTNFAQFQLLKLLAGGSENINLVADDDQAIYRFRGAAAGNILNLMENYPQIKKIVLTENYRSTQVILDTAYRLIRYNDPDRLEVKGGVNKRLKGVAGRGPAPRHLHFDNVSSEADEAARIISEKIEAGKYNYQDFAILVRSNNDADPFLRALNMRGIPWRFSGNQGLYAREEVRLVIAFLRAITNLEDSISLYHLASSEIYELNMSDLVRSMNFAQRKCCSLFDLFRDAAEGRGEGEYGDISREGKKTIVRINQDINRFLELSRRETTGRVLYTFLTHSGYLTRLSREGTVSADEKMQNLAKFFDIVRNFETLCQENRAASFITHLDMLIQAGDDPAVVEADLDVPAVNILTVHKAKGLEFSVVFIVSLVMGRFPWPRRKEAMELPLELIKDVLPGSNYHIQEERRLFYVGMTRAKKELFLTSARDYGGRQTRKISQFILEALDLPLEEAKIKKGAPLEVIKRSAIIETKERGLLTSIPEKQIIKLSHYHIDDYLTCPLKYKYVHILKVPILEHHRVVYGKTLHDAVLQYHRYKMAAKPITLEALSLMFRDSWINEGFLTREHERQRLEAGERALGRFFRQEESSGSMPAYVEKEFNFPLDNDRIVGRWDRIDVTEEGAVIIDFKSSQIHRQKDADKRAKESLQLSIYALAYQRIFGALPCRVELHFLESGLIGRSERREEDFPEAIDKIREASQGIRRSQYEPKPQYLACRYCAYREICPYTARA